MHAEAAEALADLGIPHGWQGVELVIHERHEDEVDAALDELERRHGLEEGADERQGPAREPGRESSTTWASGRSRPRPSSPSG